MPTDKGSWIEQAEGLPAPIGKTWKNSEEGESIAGRVVLISRDVGINNASTHAQLETQDGEFVGTWLSSVLSKQFTDKHVTERDVVAIRFVEWRENHRGDRYRVFAMKVLERGHEAEAAPF